jgi:signal transduction histidine kinase
LLRRTVRLQEDERRRIASDIHDAVSPLITGALYQARAMRLTSNGAGNGDDRQDTQSIVAITDLLERAMTELHDVIFALRPPDLDDLGVVAAIDRYVQQINRTGLPCQLEVVGEQPKLSPEARLGIYRIVQEALHNALRHADADEAVVKLESGEDILRVTIRDNGSGFDIEQETRPASLGLLSMRERAAAIGARLEIASRPGDGTVVILERPTTGDLPAEIEEVEMEELHQLALEAHSRTDNDTYDAREVRSA